MSDTPETASDAADQPAPDQHESEQPTAKGSASPTSPGRKPLVLFLGIAVVAGFVVAAPYLRDQFAPPPIYVQEPGHEVTGHKYLYDENLGWRNIPDWSATTMGHKLSINSLGMRDIEYEREKPAGVKRIVVVGGSFTWGYGVADGKNYTDVLEQALTKSQTQKYEVLNTGVSGWATDQEYLYLKNEGFEYEPDVVIAAFNFTDQPVYCTRSVQFGLAKPMFLNTELELANVPVPKPGTEFPKLKCEAKDVDLVLAIVHRMADECVAHDCRLVVMKFGEFFYRHHPTVAVDIALQRRLTVRNNTVLKGLSEHDAITVVDLDKVFAERRYTLDQLTRGNHDGHWNAFGHREVGNIMHDFLIEQGLVDGDASGNSAESN